MEPQNTENNNQLEQILAGLSEEEKIEVLKKMGAVSYQKILLRAMDILSDDKKTVLEYLMSQESFSQEELLEFLKKEIPNLEEVIEEESQKTATDFISILQK
ncbi:MAG: hypothetical protein WCJ57_04525 [Candidatus Falkowbacteria bacterium]